MTMHPPSPETPFDVAMVIVGVNARRFVGECLDSLRTADWRGYTHEVIYCDNGSTDGTLEMVAEKHPEARVIANGKNLGYCIAANIGARTARSRYYCFINDDTIIQRDAIAVLIEYMDAHPNVATTGARLVFPDGRDQWSGRKNPNIWSSLFSRRGVLSKWFPNLSIVRDYCCKAQMAAGEPYDVDWVSAAGHIVRPDHFWAVGGYAEDYYYWHEMVQGHRFRERGWRVVLHPRSVIVHYEGFGSGPRPFSRQRFHIVDFHRGAYRAWAEVHGQPWWSPTRLFTGMALTGRAALLLVVAFVRTRFQART
jgi:GT2 family glycosyltransferase